MDDTTLEEYTVKIEEIKEEPGDTENTEYHTLRIASMKDELGDTTENEEDDTLRNVTVKKELCELVFTDDDQHSSEEEELKPPVAVFLQPKDEVKDGKYEDEQDPLALDDEAPCAVPVQEEILRDSVSSGTSAEAGASSGCATGPHRCRTHHSSVSNIRCSTKSQLSNHNGRHTPKKSFECLECKKRFSLKSILDRHMGVHTGEKPFQCPICMRSFTRKTYLNSHKRIHAGEKPFVCFDCLTPLSLDGALNSHSRVHSGDGPFKCYVCKNNYSRKRHLDDHMRSHRGEKPIECTVCKKIFSVKDILARHIQERNQYKIDIEEKSFECSVFFVKNPT